MNSADHQVVRGHTDCTHFFIPTVWHFGWSLVHIVHAFQFAPRRGIKSDWVAAEGAAIELVVLTCYHLPEEIEGLCLARAQSCSRLCFGTSMDCIRHFYLHNEIEWNRVRKTKPHDVHSSAPSDGELKRVGATSWKPSGWTSWIQLSSIEKSNLSNCFPISFPICPILFFCFPPAVDQSSELLRGTCSTAQICGRLGLSQRRVTMVHNLHRMCIGFAWHQLVVVVVVVSRSIALSRTPSAHLQCPRDCCPIVPSRHSKSIKSGDEITGEITVFRSSCVAANPNDTASWYNHDIMLSYAIICSHDYHVSGFRTINPFLLSRFCFSDSWAGLSRGQEPCCGNISSARWLAASTLPRRGDGVIGSSGHRIVRDSDVALDHQRPHWTLDIKWHQLFACYALDFLTRERGLRPMRIYWDIWGFDSTAWSLVQWGSWTTGWNGNLNRVTLRRFFLCWHLRLSRFHQISSDLIRFPGELWLLVVALGHAALSSAAPGDVKTTRDWIFRLSKTFGSFWFTCRFNQINSWNGNCAEQTEHMDMVSLVNFVVDLALPISGLCIWFRATESTHLRAGAGTGSIGKRLLRVEISMVVTVVVNRTAWSKSFCQLQASKSPYLQASGLRVLEWFKTMDKIIIWW